MEVVDHNVVLRGAEMTDAASVRQLQLRVVVVHVQDQECAVAVDLSADQTRQWTFLVALSQKTQTHCSNSGFTINKFFIKELSEA